MSNKGKSYQFLSLRREDKKTEFRPLDEKILCHRRHENENDEKSQELDGDRAWYGIHRRCMVGGPEKTALFAVSSPNSPAIEMPELIARN